MYVSVNNAGLADIRFTDEYKLDHIRLLLRRLFSTAAARAAKAHFTLLFKPLVDPLNLTDDAWRSEGGRCEE